MSDVDLFRQMMGAETAVYSPLTPATGSCIDGTPARRPREDTRAYEREEREIFAKLEKPRVRYDVEVITKLIVYTGKEIYFASGDEYEAYITAGIAWIAVEGNPILFELIGLGQGSQGG